MIEWIKEQIEWLKSLVSEIVPGGKLKFSHKRVISLAVVWAFLSTYIRVSWDQKNISDIPLNWAFLIAAILGLAIYSNLINNKKGKDESEG